VRVGAFSDACLDSWSVERLKNEVSLGLRQELVL